MTVEQIPEDEAILVLERAMDDLRATKFPELIEVEVEDDGDKYKALRCPRCQSLVDAGELWAISPAESWDSNDEIDDDAFDHRRVYFDRGDDPDLDETLYYRHGDSPGHAVSLPEGWVEQWS
jgi:hypothetical protein